MSDESKPSGRYSGQDKPTEELSKTGIIEGLLRAMQREVQDGFAHTNADIARIKTDLHMVVDNQRSLGERVGNLENRARLASGKIQAVKVSDDEQGQLLALEQQKRAELEQKLIAQHERHERELAAMQERHAAVTSELSSVRSELSDTKKLAEDTKSLTVAQTGELERQTATLNRLATIAANPLVKDLARAIGTAILTLLLGWIATGGHK